MEIINVYSIITVLLLVAAILLHVHLSRKKELYPFVGKSVMSAGYAFFFFLVSVFFTIIIIIMQSLFGLLPVYGAAWISLALFCCIVALSGAFLITTAFEKDLRIVNNRASAYHPPHASPPQSVPLHFSLVMVNVGDLTSGGIKLSNVLKKNWIDKWSTIIQLVLCSIIVLLLAFNSGSEVFYVLGVGLFLIIIFISYDVRRVQRAFAEHQYAEVFLNALLTGALYTYLSFFGIILLLNGIRMFISLARHIRTQNLTINSLYQNLNSFAYFYLIFMYLVAFFFPNINSPDPNYILLVFTLIMVSLVAFIYWLIIGRHVTSRRYEFIGNRSAIIWGLATSVVFGLGLPLLLVGVLKYFEEPINAYFNRWRENPEMVSQKLDSLFKKKEQPKTTPVEPVKIPAKKQKEPRKLKIELKLSRAPKPEKEKKEINLRLPLKGKLKGKVVKIRNKQEVATKVSFLKTYTKEFGELLPRSASDLLVDPVKFSVLASDVQNAQLAANELAKKGEESAPGSAITYIGNLPESLLGLKVFVPPYFLEDLVQNGQVLGANIPLILVTPEIPANSPITQEKIQGFLTKNNQKLTIDFIDPSQFDLELYRHILLMFRPTLDAFHVAESIAYLNATKLGALLVPNIDWLFVQNLLTAGKIPASHVPKGIIFILPAKEVLPPEPEPQLPTSLLPPAETSRAFSIKETPDAFTMRFTYAVTLSVFILLMFAGIYFLLERLGLAPIIYLSGGFPFSPGETTIVFILWTGAILFLSLYLFLKITNLPLRSPAK